MEERKHSKVQTKEWKSAAGELETPPKSQVPQGIFTLLGQILYTRLLFDLW